MTDAVAAPPPLDVRLLGRFRVEHDGEAIRLPTREARLLLAYLVLHPESHGREQVAALFWPDVPDASARASLRNALSTLRRLLGRTLLRSDRQSVRLDPEFPLRVDVLELRDQATRYLDAPGPDPHAVDLDLYKGDLLADVYEDWVAVERRALRDLYLRTLLELTRQMRSHGEYEQAIELAGRVLAADPANEHAHQHLMFCHVALGDRGAALRQYEACRNALDDKLAVEPSAATEKLRRWAKEAPPERPPMEAAPTNLPIPVTSFVGRRHEIAAVRDRLASTRLLTLTGAGGSGKSRLAIRAATGLVEAYRDGVWWVELAALADPEALPHALAKTLGVPEVPQRPITDSLTGFLRPRELLLVLDDCEHLTAACARLVESLLRRCPTLTVLATSRETLGVPGEQVWPVPTLDVAGPDGTPTAEDLHGVEAVELFVARAMAVNPEFSLGDDNAPAVAEVCRRLDGLPLALELAAARVNVLTVEQIGARLDDAFRLLTGGGRTELPRHRTLRAAFDWSVDLLSEGEVVLLRRLSVFSGGWTLPAAEAVCAGGAVPETEVFELLARLVEKSLVEARERGGETRFRMLQTIRQYSRELLLDSGELAAVRCRHLDHFAGWVESAGAHLGFFLPDAEMDDWLGRIEAEQDNLRAAAAWSLRPDDTGPEERRRSLDAGLRLLTMQHAFWFTRGRFTEGRSQLDRLLQRGTEASPEPRALALLTAGYLAAWQGDFAAARRPLEEAQEQLRRLGDDSAVAFATHGLGFAAVGEGDTPRARLLFEEALRRAREADDPWIISFALHFLAIVLTYEGDHATARAYFEEGNAYIRSAGGHRQGVAFSHFHLARIARLEGDHAAAGSANARALRLFREAGDRRGIGYALSGFAVLAATAGDAERAARLAGAVAALEAVLGSFLEAPLQSEYDREIAMVRETLGEDDFAALADEGRAAGLDEVVAEALEEAS